MNNTDIRIDRKSSAILTVIIKHFEQIICYLYVINNYVLCYYFQGSCLSWDERTTDGVVSRSNEINSTLLDSGYVPI